MRRPTPREKAYAWHTAAVRAHRLGQRLAVTAEPRCGYFKRQLVRHGPFVPARIWLEAELDDAGELLAPEVMLCEVNGLMADPVEQWTWICARPISRDEWDYLEALRLHCMQHEPGHPSAQPREPVDWLNSPLPDFT